MLDFACPSCSKRVQGDDSFAGKHVLCPSCSVSFLAPPLSHAGATAITDALPPAAHAFGGDGAVSEGLPPRELPPPDVKKPAPRTVFSFVLVFGSLAVLVTAVALLVPSVERVREASARTQSNNNLKQIGLAMQSFHDANKRLPFNGTVQAAAGDNTSGSWAFQILPFIDQAGLFLQPNANTGVITYMCPGRGRQLFCATGAWTDYCINPWLNDKDGRVNAPDVKRTLLGITDGASNTIFAGHGNIDPDFYGSVVAHAQSTDIFKGGNPALARRSTTNRADRKGDGALNWGGPFPTGVLTAWCDGTVRTIPYATTGGIIRDGKSTAPGPFGDGNPVPPNVVWPFGVFLTPTGGEMATLPD